MQIEHGSLSVRAPQKDRNIHNSVKKKKNLLEINNSFNFRGPTPVSEHILFFTENPNWKCL